VNYPASAAHVNWIMCLGICKKYFHTLCGWSNGVLFDVHYSVQSCGLEPKV